MAFLFTTLLTFLAIEYFLRVPFLSHIQALILLVRKITHTLLSPKISDHWKETVLLAYAWKLIVNSIVILFMLIGCLILVGGVAWILDQLVTSNTATIDVLSSVSGLIIMIAASIGYFLLRKQYVTHDYNAGDRLLHRLALDYPLVRRASFDIEALFVTNNKQTINERHIFVCGLARAGTTILMRSLYDSGQLCSLTYRNMPFVLMPQLWKKLSAPFQKQKQVKERAHGDGILVNFDSPEAFEEVFWRSFCGKEYIFDNYLKPHHVSEDVIAQFRNYISSIISSSDNPGQPRYLSKNNNNILRLDAIRSAFPKALIIIQFRDPVQQALSLLSQHRIFLERHSNDKFSCDYMRWLGHHEFGATHQPFQFNDGANPTIDFETDNINYWLNVWICTYRFLLEKAPAGCTFICYENLCTEPETVLNNLFLSADLSSKKTAPEKIIYKQANKCVEGIDITLKNQAEQLYQNLLTCGSN